MTDARKSVGTTAIVARKRLESCDRTRLFYRGTAGGSGVTPRVDCLQSRFVLARIASWLDRAAFSPDSLPDDLVFGAALAPSVIAGLVIFRLPAVEMLGI